MHRKVFELSSRRKKWIFPQPHRITEFFAKEFIMCSKFKEIQQKSQASHRLFVKLSDWVHEKNAKSEWPERCRREHISLAKNRLIISRSCLRLKSEIISKCYSKSSIYLAFSHSDTYSIRLETNRRHANIDWDFLFILHFSFSLFLHFDFHLSRFYLQQQFTERFYDLCHLQLLFAFVLWLFHIVFRLIPTICTCHIRTDIKPPSPSPGQQKYHTNCFKFVLFYPNIYFRFNVITFPPWCRLLILSLDSVGEWIGIYGLLSVVCSLISIFSWNQTTFCSLHTTNNLWCNANSK